ncbi:hypothetical protein ILUMI_11813 [Ignelater luminosus]|uniref:Uncharacterized protein n=1 Tax=Ignelater luminosus TaxID=2038154 RepID=A0A8K0GCW8_IGNLU|nr:hypothetical protein ILUMI_11813 [Ignelater luminosus]
MLSLSVLHPGEQSLLTVLHLGDYVVEKFFQVLKEENREIKELKNMEIKIERMEKDGIKNNIVISGLKFEKDNINDLKIGMECFMEKSVGAKIQVAVYKIELNTTNKKETVMNNESKLKEYKERIYTNNKVTKEEQVTQKKLKEIAEEERRKKSEARIPQNNN